MPCSSLASLRTLLLVQRSGDCGSPRVTGSTSRSRSSLKPGSLLTLLLRPPPFLRIRPSPTLAPCCSSLIPWLMTGRESPVARETIETPPHPIASASLAASSRRVRSFSSVATRSYRCLTSSSLFMSHRLPYPPSLCQCYSLTTSKIPRLSQRTFLSCKTGEKRLKEAYRKVFNSLSP